MGKEVGGPWEGCGEPRGPGSADWPTPRDFCKGPQLVKQVGILKYGVSQAWLIIRRTYVLIKMHIPRPRLELLSQTFQGKMSQLRSEGCWVLPSRTSSSGVPERSSLRIPPALNTSGRGKSKFIRPVLLPEK